jgi:hypothetical protein
MTKKIVSATAMLIGAGSLLAGCTYDQPTAGCITQDSTSWIAEYKLVEGSVTGTDIATGTACTAASAAAKLKGERIGVYKYSDPNNLSDTKLVIRASGMASLGARDVGDPARQNAVGQFSSLEPDTATDLCSVPEFSTAEADAPEAGANARVVRSYKFKDVFVYSAPSAPGTTMKGAFTYANNGCSAQYTFHAMWPLSNCNPEYDTDEEKKEHPAESCGPGSHTNQDFKLRCNGNLKFAVVAPQGSCVLDYAGDGEFPPKAAAQ